MRIGWLTDPVSYVGGAELTQEEFRQAVPDGIELVDCPPGEVERGLDAYIAHNVTRYDLADLDSIRAPFTWYHHDLSPWIKAGVRRWLDDKARHIFCSPLQRDRYAMDGPCIPPPLDVDRFKPTRQARKHRKGVVSIAQWRNPGKGGRAVIEWATENDQVDVYGDGPYVPAGLNIKQKGPLKPEQVASTLLSYKTFVFLPFDVEPFCRCVAEAWASGCDLVVNANIGALHWIANDPDALQTASKDFWERVLD